MTSTRHSATCSIGAEDVAGDAAERAAGERGDGDGPGCGRGGERSGPPSRGQRSEPDGDGASRSRPADAGTERANSAPSPSGRATGTTPMVATAAPRPRAWAATSPPNAAAGPSDGHGDDAQHDRAAQRGDAVGAVARVLEDLQPPLDRPPAGDGVGRVGEPVLVERAGHEDADEHGDGGGDSGRHELAQAGGDAADECPDERADHREPHDDRRRVGGSGAPDGDPGEELDGAEEPRPVRQHRPDRAAID